MRERGVLWAGVLGLGLTVALLLGLGGGAEAADQAAPPQGPGEVFCVTHLGGTYPECDQVFGGIQEAVDAASGGEVIKIAAGLYTSVHTITAWLDYPSPPADGLLRQVVHITRTVTLQGGYTVTDWVTPNPLSHTTVLSAGGVGRGVLIAGEVSPTIEGLYITGGNATGLGGGPYGWDTGGGIYVIASAALVSNCFVYGNDAEVGGGLFLFDTDSSIISNEVWENAASRGAGLYLRNSPNALLSGNFIHHNIAPSTGGGVYLSSSPIAFMENIVASNNASSGGGLYLAYSDAVLEGNTLRLNISSQGGGVYLYRSGPTFRRNQILLNIADGVGSGLYAHQSSPLLVNNVIADNQSQSSGAAVVISEGTPRLLHNTVAGNQDVGVEVLDGGTAALTNTILVGHQVGVVAALGSEADLEGTLWGSGSWENGQDWGGDGTIVTGTVNIWDNPRFVDSEGRDYHVESGGGGVDVGVDAGVAVDMDGESRPAGAGFDIGADEVPAAGLTVVKYAQPDPVRSGGMLTYTILVTNVRPTTVSVVVTDTLPPQVVPGGVLAWTPTLTAEGGMWSRQVVVTVQAGYFGYLTNVVTVRAEDGATVYYTALSYVPAPVYLPLMLRP